MIILGISMHLGMTTQTAVSIFDLDLNFTVHQLYKLASTLASTIMFKKSKRNVQGVPQSQTAALPRPQEEEETDKSKQAQTEQTYEKH